MRAQGLASSFSLSLLLSLAAVTLAAGCGHRRHRVSSPCPEGASWDGASCAPVGAPAPLPTDAPEQAPTSEEQPAQAAATAPEWTCPGGSVAQGDGCVCPDATAWIDQQCQSTRVAQAAAPPGRPQRQRSAWIPAAPAPPQAPSLPNVNLQEGVASAARTLQPAPAQQPARAQKPAPASPPPARSRPTSPPPTVTLAACTNGMVRNGNACQCPQGTGWENGQCLVTCHPTQRRDGKACICPKDTRWNGSQCELWQECRGGQVHFGAACICPPPSRWDGQRCAPAAARR